jgi:F-type H+-transporting ATPase subunit delta
MAETRVASRYAKSLIELAQERGILEQVNEDMVMFIKVAEENPQFASVLKNPIINHSKKLGVLTAMFKGRVSDLTYSFFEIITRKNRETLLVEIAKEAHLQYNAINNIQNATVTTSFPLTDDLRADFQAMVMRKTGMKAELKEKVDPSLIGGYILKIGDRQIDDSVKSRLNSLKLKFSDNPYIAKL